MKNSLVTLIATLLTASSLSTFACGNHDYSAGFDGPLDTDELKIYDDVEELIREQESEGSIEKGYSQPGPFLGLPMRYPVYAHPAANQATALATVHNGMPIVLFAPMAPQRLGRNIMGFVLQHEYAHHDLRHLFRNNESSAMKEAEADCQATRELVNNGLRNIIPEVVNFWQSQGCHYDPRTPINQVRASHPCGTQRAQIIKQCAGMR